MYVQKECIMPKPFAMILAAGFLLWGFSCSRSAEQAETGTAEKIQIAPTDWPWWRGPNRDGIASADQSPPLKWSETQNVLWKIAIPGRGHGSPIVVGDQVFVTTADEERDLQTVCCIHKDTGEQVWETAVHRGGIMKKGNKKASQASTSVACDGKRVFVNFLNDGAVYTTALDRQGEKLWQTKISDYVVHQGYGSSPAVFGSMVFVSADNKGGGAIAGLDRATGDVIWRTARPDKPNYASPVILKACGREQLVFTGCDMVTSFEPETGKKLWEIEGSTTECVTSTVTDGDLVFTSGGYPKNHVSAVKADGSGEIVWEKNVRVYVPSMLARDGFLYAVTDNGVATCWKAATGENVWQHRLGGTFTSSPVLMGDHLFASNEAGTTFVLKVTETGVEEVAENQLGDEVYSTPTICGGRIYMRVAKQINGNRQEFLFCLGAK
jgi:outer membrane protein assembly factor BamB